MTEPRQSTTTARELADLEVRWWRLHHTKDRDALPRALAEYFSAMFMLSLDQATEACASFLRAVHAHDAKTWNAASDLEQFYSTIQRATGRPIPVAAAAHLEERWWKLHDESSDVCGDVALEDTIAELYQSLFQIPRQTAQRVAYWRLRAIHAHDQAEAPSASTKQSDAWWRTAASHLEAAYNELPAFRDSQ